MHSGHRSKNGGEEKWTRMCLPMMRINSGKELLLLYSIKIQFSNYHEKTATVCLWTCPLNGKGSWVSRNAFLVVPSLRMTLETRKGIVRVVWNLEFLRRGTSPQADHEGVPFLSDQTRRRRDVPGPPIMREDYRAVFAWWKGDISHNKACICFQLCSQLW